MAATKHKVVIVDVEKVERLTREIIETLNEHLLQENMTGPEVVIALQTAAYHVMQAKEELIEEIERLAS